MEKVVYLINLFDIYSELFTEKQKLYFMDYYFNNFTLQEISENYDVTRNAIHKSLKETEEKLLYYEEKLGIYDKSQKILSLLEDNIELKEKVEEIL
jgi:predicted DNA-binding protein YlxM (UPF0122 family)